MELINRNAHTQILMKVPRDAENFKKTINRGIGVDGHQVSYQQKHMYDDERRVYCHHSINDISKQLYISHQHIIPTVLMYILKHRTYDNSFENISPFLIIF